MIRRHRVTALLALLCMLGGQSAWAQHELRSDRFTTSDGAELHYLVAGSGPTIIFVPGWTGHAEIWEPQLLHFAASHRVVGLDPRSQGRSEKVAEGHHLVRRGQDIGELIGHLGAAPAVVVGWSLAVLEVLTYAQEFGTDALRAAVLVDMFIGKDPRSGEAHPCDAAGPMIARLQSDRQGFTSEFVRGMYRSQQPDEYLEDVVRALLATPKNTAITLVASACLSGPGDWRSALDSLDRPVLYLAAPEVAAQAQMVRERRPDARVEVFESAGHALFVDEPERFNRLLEEFLATLAEQRS